MHALPRGVARSALSPHLGAARTIFFRHREPTDDHRGFPAKVYQDHPHNDKQALRHAQHDGSHRSSVGADHRIYNDPSSEALNGEAGRWRCGPVDRPSQLSRPAHTSGDIVDMCARFSSTMIAGPDTIHPRQRVLPANKGGYGGGGSLATDQLATLGGGTRTQMRPGAARINGDLVERVVSCTVHRHRFNGSGRLWI